MKKNTRFVGLDVHKDTIAVAVAEPGRNGEVKFHGTIANSKKAVARLIKKLGPVENLDFCYEAGPCGYVLYWLLLGLGAVCSVVAPSLIPERAGDRVKTDRRDAEKLARLHRSGELTTVWVPDREHEALRDLVRAREAAVEDRTRARNRLTKFLLRRGITKPKGWSSWTNQHRIWLEQQVDQLPIALDRITLTDHVQEVRRLDERIGRLEQALDDALADAPEELQAVVAGLAAFKGIGRLTAATLAVEVGRFSRFDNPTQLMSYCGLVPSEYSTGGPGKANRGKITKTGNAHLRRVVVEAAWHYSKRPRLSRALGKRQALMSERLAHHGQVAQEIVATSWKTQQRLSRRYQRLLLRGKPSGKAIVAVGRELLGFVWDAAVRIEASYAARKEDMNLAA